jgi:heme exporter protein C
MLAAIFMVFVLVPSERDQGVVQRIFYFHVNLAWMAFGGFALVAAMSVWFLRTGDRRADRLAHANAEVGMLFTTLVLVTGPIWARPIWGVWWTWDPRLTSTAVLLLIFVGYLALRGFVEDADRRAQWSAAVGILGALNVPIVYMSVKWWRTIHQLQSSPSTVDPEYVVGLRANAVAMLLVVVYFIVKRYRAAQVERMAEQLAERAALEGGRHG